MWPVTALCLLAGLSAAAVAQDAGYTGVASCAGSTCHGRAEGNGAVVRQDEIAIWQEPSASSGAHSRALAVLSGLRSRQIAATLGIDDPTGDPACLGCHATFAPAAERGPRFQLSDGVGCESCHGPAGGWIATHYTTLGSHPANLAAGLVPLENPQVRAGVCLDCHYGSAKGNQFVTHRMMAAGHPRIVFELDLFSALQQHHDEDADYARRKGRTDSVRLWAVGQAEGGVPGLAEGRLPDGTRYLEVYSHPLEVAVTGRGDNAAPLTGAQLAKALTTDAGLSGVVVDPAGPWIRLTRQDLEPLLALAD